MTQQPVFRLGVIGLGPDWQSRYGPSLAKLPDDIRVTTVFDVTIARAEEVAKSLKAAVARGVRHFFSASQLDAVLLLDLGWQQGWLLETACRAALPLFLGRDVMRAPGMGARLEELVPIAHDVIVPEQPVGYHASMLRLRELIATQIGPVERVHINHPASEAAFGQDVTLSELLSWCCVAFGLRAAQVAELPSDESRASSTVRRLTLPTRESRRLVLEVTLQASNPSREAPSVQEPVPFCTILSVDGRADLLSSRELRWDAGEGPVVETLEGDRSAMDVLLDLFTRRAAGGLIPVPDLNDLRQGEQLASLVLGVSDQ